MRPMKTPRFLQLSGLALLAITGCHEGEELDDMLDEDVEERVGNLAPHTLNSLRVMRVDVDCNENDAFDPIDVYDMPLQTRMSRLASIILANDPDVVMIHEARSDECRDQLVTELKDAYPQYVSDIYYSNHGYADFTQWDFRPSSGMMLFSKYDFEAFPPERGGLFGKETVIVEDQDGNHIPMVIETPLYVEGSGFDEGDRYVAARNIESDQDSLTAIAVVRIASQTGEVFHVMMTGGASWESVAQDGNDMLWAALAPNELTDLPVFSLPVALRCRSWRAG
jgi:hypothetical protein